jgi:hypothetical protein
VHVRNACQESKLDLRACSDSERLRLWEPSSDAHLHTLRSDRRFERVNVAGLTGVIAAQRVSLLALGAVDRAEPSR